MALIIDTGVRYASLDRTDDGYDASRALIEAAREPLVLPAPVLAEIDYLVHDRMGLGPCWPF